MELGNVTNNDTSVVHGWHIVGAWKLQLIEGYVCLTSITLSFLAVFGSFRRRSHSLTLRNIIRAAYVLSTYFISYTIGQMQSYSLQNEWFAIWAVFFNFVVGSTDSITAFSLEDNEKIMQYHIQLIVQSFWTGWLINSVENTPTNTLVLANMLLLLTSIRTNERAQAMSLASRSGLEKNTKLLSDFMAYEHENSQGKEEDPVSMKRYNYLVFGDDDKNVKITPPDYRKKLVITDEVLTISKVWECKGRLLNSRDDASVKLKDIVLSFALFRLLCRRFGGYPFLESTREKTWKFVRDGLLSEEQNGYDRAFRVIEVELAFLYDFFYTKYPVIIQPKNIRYRIIQAICVMIGCWFMVYTLLKYRHNAGVRVTGIVMLAIVLVEIVQVILIIFSDWLKVFLVWKYVTKPSWLKNKLRKKLLHFVSSRQWLKPWERKLGQYSLLKSFDHKFCLKNAYEYAYHQIVSNLCKIFGLENRNRKGISESSRIELPIEVKKAVLCSLRKSGGRLSNGEVSLEANGVGRNLSWACKLETNTHVIMVWHIATSLCEQKASKQVIGQENFITATSLSKYCAYLVAFAPRLLPDPAYNTVLIFDQIIIEAKDFLKGCNSMTKMHIKLMEIGRGSPGDTIVERGAKLANSLVQDIDGEDLRWKVLADFWAELMLFLSPSDDMNAHAEFLAMGGQFVTHLWALLSHAGILERPPPDTQEQPPSDTQEQSPSEIQEHPPSDKSTQSVSIRID